MSVTANENSTVTLEADASNQAQPRLEFLDGLRALTALYVVAYHALLQVWPVLRGVQPHGTAKVLFGWLGYGAYGVVVFLVVSGFCLMLTVAGRDYQLPKGVSGFFWKRILRIVPPYYAAIALSLMLALTVLSAPIGTHYDICIPATLEGVKGNLLFIPEMTGSNTNHVFWSIGIEAKVYFIFPLALFLWKRIGGLFTCTLITALSLLVPQMVPITAPWISHYFGLFAMGMLAADVNLNPGTPLRKLLPIAFFLIVGLVGALSWFLPRPMLLEYAIPVHLLVGSAAAMAMCLMKNHALKPLAAFLSNAKLTLIGLASYSLYLIHAPLLQLFSKYFTQPMLAHCVEKGWKYAPILEYGLFLTLALPIIVATSMLFAYVFEGKYFRKGLRKKQIPPTFGL